MSEKLLDYLKSSGHKVVIDTNPSLEKILRLEALRNEGVRRGKLLIEAMKSKNLALVLLEEAYSKGEFDVIIAHLEEAKKLK